MNNDERTNIAMFDLEPDQLRASIIPVEEIAIPEKTVHLVTEERKETEMSEPDTPCSEGHKVSK